MAVELDKLPATNSYGESLYTPTCENTTRHKECSGGVTQSEGYATNCQCKCHITFHTEN